jgi:hypothetical protein
MCLEFRVLVEARAHCLSRPEIFAEASWALSLNRSFPVCLPVAEGVSAMPTEQLPPYGDSGPTQVSDVKRHRHSGPKREVNLPVGNPAS